MAKLDTKITLFGLTMIAIGSCIGAGIFATPGVVAQSVPNQWLIIAVWTCGGLVALTGALTFAELGGMFPKAGGVYVFIKETYGPFWGFLYGWIILLAVNTGALAALTIAFTDYLTYFLPLTSNEKLIISLSIIGLMSIINSLGVSISQWFSSIFTILKLAAIFIIILLAAIYFSESKTTVNWEAPILNNPSLLSGFFLGLVGVLWSFGGWHHASYLAGETINPTKNVPRAMIIGALIVTITYILINIAYMVFLPIEELAISERVAGDAIEKYLSYGGKLVAAMVMISIFGTIAIYSMSAPRVYFAMARDKVFFRFTGKINPRWNTPANAIMIQGIWAMIIILLGKNFRNIITYAVFMDIAFMVLTALAVLQLRKSRPNVERPFHVPFYPIVPIIFILISGIFLINVLLFRPIEAFSGIGLALLGIPFYLIFKNQNK